MKRTIILILLFSSIENIFSQNLLIIDDSTYGGYNLPFIERTIVPSKEVIDLDIDADSISDISLDFHYADFSNWYELWINLNMNNGLKILVDTNFSSISQFRDTNGIIHDTLEIYTIIKRYNSGDTIKIKDQPSLTNAQLLNIVWANPDWAGAFYPIKLDNFIGDTCFIAFWKNDLEIYYMEIFIEEAYSWDLELHLISLKGNDKGSFINKTLLDAECLIFPNPVNDWFTIVGNVNIIEIYSLEGKMVYNKNINKNEKIDIYIGNLNSGVYFIKCYNNKTPFIKKIIKY